MCVRVRVCIPVFLGSKEWQLPPEEIWPDATYVSGYACETQFLDCDDEECDITIKGAKVPLQKLSLVIPSGGWSVCWANEHDNVKTQSCV